MISKDFNFRHLKYFYLFLCIVSAHIRCGESSSGDMIKKLIKSNQFEKSQQFIRNYTASATSKKSLENLLVNSVIKRSKKLSLYENLVLNEDYSQKLKDKLLNQYVVLLTQKIKSKEIKALSDISNKIIKTQKIHFPKAFNLGEVISKFELEKFPYELTKKLIEPALNSSVYNMYCDLKVVTELYLEIFNKTKKFAENVNQNCRQEILNSISEKLPLEDSNFSKFLTSSNTNNKFLRSVLYLLDGELEKNIFNQAWNEILALKKLPKKRKEIIEKIKKLDPIPDKNLYSNLKNQQVYNKKFFENFPEFMNYYFQSCYQYLAGIKDFPRGNPTPNCNKIIKSDLELSQSMYFEEIKKLLQI